MVANNSLGLLGHKLSADSGPGYHISMYLNRKKRPSYLGRYVEIRTYE
jgi:hypothetical protein